MGTQGLSHIHTGPLTEPGARRAGQQALGISYPALFLPRLGLQAFAATAPLLPSAGDEHVCVAYTLETERAVSQALSKELEAARFAYGDGQLTTDG